MSDIKIAALMPLRINPDKTMWPQASADAARICDAVIVLHDRQRNDLQGFRCTEELRVEGGDGVWNDWCNRATLLARAAKYGCRWVMWLDDDETLGPSLTRERAHRLCAEAEAGGFVQVIVKVRTMWNETHYRVDGIFGSQHKSFFQLNPFALKHPEFEFPPTHVLHHFPTLAGPKMMPHDYILHWGMKNRALREVNTAKYEQADPEKKFSGVPYNYLLNEEGIKLLPTAPEPITLIMPTRGRRAAALEAIASVLKTADLPDLVKIVLCMDNDDPGRFSLTARNIVCRSGARKRFLEWVNLATELPLTGWVGWLADDIRYQTPGWDSMVRSHRELVVYGSDGYQNEKMATHPFIRAEIPNALGWLIPSELVHYCADVFIMALARELNSLAYDPQIKTEHLHPAAGKADVDQTYADRKLFWEQDHRAMRDVVQSRIPGMAALVREKVTT